jgi:hypothetical protein
LNAAYREGDLIESLSLIGGAGLFNSGCLNTAVVRFVSIGVSRIRLVIVGLILSTVAICSPKSRAQQTSPVDTTNSFPPREFSSATESAPVSGPQIQIDNSPYWSEEDFLKLEFFGDHRRTVSGNYESVSSGGLALLCAATDKDSVGLSLELGVVQLARGSVAAANLTDPRFLQAGFVVRHYFTPSHVFLRPYATVNANYFWMVWDYQTPVLFNDGTSIDGDSVEGVDASASVGLAIRLHRHVNLFGEFTGGGVATLPQTEAGLDNDLLGSFGYVGVKAGFSVVF